MYGRNRNARLLTGGLVGVPPGYGDEHWNDVTLLLDGNNNNTDRSNAAHSLTWDTTPSYNASGKFGQCLDMTTHWLEGPSGAATNDFTFGTGPFTLEAWVWFPNGVTTADKCLFETRSTVGDAGMVWFFTGGAPSIGMNVYSNAAYRGGFNTSYNMTTQTWYHVALVRNGNTFTYYVDGQAAGSYTAAVTLDQPGTEPLRVGNKVGEGGPVSALVDDFRVTKGVARYTGPFDPPTKSFPINAPGGRRGVGTEAALRTRGYLGAAPAVGGMLTLYDLYHSPYKQLLPITNGLVLHLEAGETSSYPGSGSTWYDLSDSGYTFTAASGRMPTFNASGIKCFNFSTGSKFFDSTTNSPFSGNSFDVTVIAVVSQTTTGSFRTVLGQGVDVAGGGMSFHSRSGQFATDQWQPTGRTMSSAASTNTVQQVAWTVPSWSTHGTSTKIYVDGTEQTTAQYGTASTPSLQAGKLRVGSWKEDRTNNDMDWRGNIYAIYVYDRVLSASEIQQIFDATKGRYGIS